MRFAAAAAVLPRSCEDKPSLLTSPSTPHEIPPSPGAPPAPQASTSTVRIAGSSQATPYACVAAGIASLWGPAHGGANVAVIEMLQQIGSRDRIPEFLARAKDKANPFRLMGFGHRLYKTMDPRANLMRKLCHDLLAHLGGAGDPLLRLAMDLEAAALADPYFAQRKLYPNVDFYSGICLRALGIPTSMFTVIFAVGRATGWVSQWREMMQAETAPRISRPRQMYLGSLKRDWVPLEKRLDDGHAPPLPLAAAVPLPPNASTGHKEARSEEGRTVCFTRCREEGRRSVPVAPASSDPTSRLPACPLPPPDARCCSSRMASARSCRSR